MILKTLTGIRITDNDPTLDLPCAINDTFIAKTPLNFVVSLTMLNSMLGTSINSGNIGNFSLFVRVITATTADTFLSVIIPLSASNIINGFVVVDITSISNDMTNDFILLHCTENDIHNLFKKYRIAFRVFQTASGTGDQLQLLANDIVGDLNMCLNTYETGPYDVEFSQLDLFNPTDFTVDERRSALFVSPASMGTESVRAFFPSNMNKRAPLIVYNHGNNQYVEGADSYLSTFASYGYFCLSISLTQNGDDFKINPHNILSKIEHFKKNISKINSGRFLNKIDFNKIIISGLSRGGMVTEAIAQLLRTKNAINSALSGFTIEYSDLKALIPIGDVTLFTVGSDGIIVANQQTIGVSYNPDTDGIDYFNYEHNIPVIKINGFNDSQSAFYSMPATMFRSGFCYNTKLNELDKYALFSNSSHNSLVDLGAQSDELSFISLTSTRNISNHILNSNRLVLNEYISWILYFLSINCFSSNKLKKLRFIDPKKQKINTLLKDEVKTTVFHTFYPKADDVLIQIDNFYGITMSHAGTTGFTFTNPLGFTYDYCLDSKYYSAPGSGQTYVNNLKEMKSFYGFLNDGSLMDLTDNDSFNGIQFNSYKSLFAPIQSNVSMGYTFTSNLILSENNYIGLRACHTYIFDGVGITKNGNYSNFNLTLFDKNNNSATVSSRNYSNGIYPVNNINTSPSNMVTNSLFSRYPTIPNFCFFRAGDFFMKNQSLGITQINRMRLDFGPDSGSTFAHLAFDAFVVYKEL
jgi:hypothetical protein